MKKISRALASYFIQGILYVIPTALTVYVIWSLFQFIDGLIPYDYPGVGLVTLIVSLTVLGFLANSIIASPIKKYFGKLINKAPLVKTLYSAFADLITAFVGKKKSFKEPVLVRLSQEHEIEKPGFITSRDLEKIGIEGEKVAVYLPHSYAFSGNMFIVPVKNVILLKVSSADLMKFIVSGGVADIKEKIE